MDKGQCSALAPHKQRWTVVDSCQYTRNRGLWQVDYQGVTGLLQSLSWRTNRPPFREGRNLHLVNVGDCFGLRPRNDNGWPVK